MTIPNSGRPLTGLNERDIEIFIFQIRKFQRAVLRFVKICSCRLYPEPTCIYCSCTKSKACPAGCSWWKLNLASNAGVCSSCKEKDVQTSAKTKVQGEI